MIFGKLKILLLGSAQSGKTSILDVYNQKMTYESPTVGVSVSSGCVLDNSGQWRKPTPVRFYDMGGARHWWCWIPEYIKNTDIVFLFYDITRPSTLEEAEEILTILHPFQNSFQIILVGNKTDLEESRKIQIFDINKWIGKKRRDGWMLRHIECNRRNITSFKKILDRAINGLEMSLEPLDLTKANPFFDKAKDQAGWMDYFMPF